VSLEDFWTWQVAARWQAFMFPVREHTWGLRLGVVRLVCKTLFRCRDRSLAHELHALADTYDPRPTGEWE